MEGKSTYSPVNVRPRDGWVVVLAEKREKKLQSGIYLPNHETGVEKVCEGAGVLVRIGGGEKNKLLDVKVGQRVLYRGFLRWANPIETEEKWDDGENKQYFIMNVDDVFAIIEGNTQVGIFSGRPMVPEMTTTPTATAAQGT